MSIKMLSQGQLPDRFYDSVVDKCQQRGSYSVWLGADLCILLIGVLANSLLLWLFVRERKSLTVSQVIGVNLVLMDFLFLSSIPFSLAIPETSNRNITPHLKIPMNEAKQIFGVFNLIGCPLLLTCMCMERYMAVMRPILYLRLRKLEYRAAVCAVVWIVTISFCLLQGFVGHEGIHVMTIISIVISCLFSVMLACFGRIVWSLLQQSPAHANRGNQSHSEHPLKRQAVYNVLAVLVPAVVSYMPNLLLLPLLIYVFYKKMEASNGLCSILDISLLCPKFGVFIAPLFYLSKARQICGFR